jgi:hypothetical protein
MPRGETIAAKAGAREARPRYMAISAAAITTGMSGAAIGDTNPVTAVPAPAHHHRRSRTATRTHAASATSSASG